MPKKKEIIGNDDELFSAFYLLYKNFQDAKKKKYIYKPLSWALFQVWKFYDSTEKKREDMLDRVFPDDIPKGGDEK